METENLKMIRWKQRFENFEKSYSLLEENFKKENLSELERAGLIQFFEMTIELSWKLMKDYLESEEIIVKSPRDAIKQSLSISLIEDGELWLEALESRNLTTHTYDDEIAEKMQKNIQKKYFYILQNLYLKLSKEI